jgi:hypothetical protein
VVDTPFCSSRYTGLPFLRLFRASSPIPDNRIKKLAYLCCVLWKKCACVCYVHVGTACHSCIPCRYPVSAFESLLPHSFTPRGYQSYILRLQHTIRRHCSQVSTSTSGSFSNLISHLFLRFSSFPPTSQLPHLDSLSLLPTQSPLIPFPSFSLLVSSNSIRAPISNRSLTRPQHGGVCFRLLKDLFEKESFAFTAFSTNLL